MTKGVFYGGKIGRSGKTAHMAYLIAEDDL